MKDLHCQLQCNGESSPKGTVLYPLSSVLSYHSLSPLHLKYTLAISAMVEPNTYNQAIKSKEWTQAMKDELTALETNQTWYLTELPRGKTPIGFQT